MSDSVSEHAGGVADLKMARRRRAANNGTLNTERLPPHSEDMERGTLGCCLISPQECIDQVIEIIGERPEPFYDLRHQTIWSEIVEMFDERLAVDVLTLHQRLKDKQLLEQIGGIPYLNALQDTVPSAANVTYYANIVREKFILRNLIKSCTEIVCRAYEYEGEIDTLLDESEREILSIRRLRENASQMPTMHELVHESIIDIERIFERRGQIGGMTTGFVDLDKYTDGLHPGDMIVLVAYPSVGKTSLAMNIAEHVALNLRLPVGVFSMEMTAKQLVTRALCSNGRVNLMNIRDGFMSESDFPKLTSAAGRLIASPMHIDDSSDLTIQELRAKARRMSQQHGTKLFVVDYLQLAQSSGRRSGENRAAELTEISNGLKRMAKELGAAVLVLSQLNDDGKILGSRQPGMDGDGVWELERDDQDSDESCDAVKLTIKKNRNGPRGVIVNLTFLKQYTRFESAARVSDEDVPTGNQSQFPDR